jgi:hypothetical protein
MGLPRTFVGFSSTDLTQYYLMLAWKEHEHIDFDFFDCQLQKEINSEDEDYIKGICRKRIRLATHFVQLIGEDTKSKYKYVRWEAEVAKEKGCVIIGANLNAKRSHDSDRTPTVISNIGAIFVPFSPAIIKYALENYQMHDDNDNYHYKAHVYEQLGYK